MSEVERLRKALEQIAKMTMHPWRQDELMQSIANAALVPAPPESRDTATALPAFGEWHDARYPKPRAIEGTVALMEWGERRAYRQTGWDAAVLRCGIAGVAAGGAAGATTAAALAPYRVTRGGK